MKRSNCSTRVGFIALLVLLSLCFSGSTTRGQKDRQTVGTAAIKTKNPTKPLPKMAGRLDKLSPDLAQQLVRSVNHKKLFKVICQFNRPAGSGVQAIYRRPRVTVSYSFQNSSI